MATRLIEVRRAAAAAAIPAELRAIVDLVKKAPLFNGLTEEQLAAFLALGQRRQFQPGETIIQVGDHGDSLFVLLEGRVRILIPMSLPTVKGDLLSGEKNLLEIPAPAPVGQFNLLESTERSATVEALTEVRALEIVKQDFDQFAERDPVAGYRLVRNMALDLSRSLRNANATNRKLTTALSLAVQALRR